MSYILFYAPAAAPPPVVTVAYIFNLDTNSMYLPTMMP